MNLVEKTALAKTSYDITACQPGIVHIGYGAFHRAHQAVFIDDYMEASGDLRWGIVALNLRESESKQFAQMARSQGGYVLKTTDPEGIDAYRLVRPHVGFADWSQDAAQAEMLLAADTVHMVTITVTESGYHLNDDGRSLNVADPLIAAEVQGGDPSTVYGYLARAIDRRMQADGGPLSILCCDNIRANGKMLRTCLLNYLDAMGRADLAAWVRENASFPCSMVDRITPRTSEELLGEIAARFPDYKTAPIGGEAFVQWVLENNFAGPAPVLQQAGVEVVDDVDPYEEAKIRILNGGHSGLCYLGALAGYETFDAAMLDPKLEQHFDGWEFENVLPGLTLDLPFDKHQYCLDVKKRFGNAAISDQLSRICMDGWSKMPIYVRTTLGACLEQGISPTYGYDCVASWYVFARRVAAGTMPVSYHEPYWDHLEPLLQPGREDDFARTTELWGTLPTTYLEFVPGVVSAIKRMETTWPV